MTGRLILIFFCSVLFSLGGCKDSPGYRVENYKELKLTEMPEDITIPSGAWDLLEMQASGVETSSAGQIVFSEIHVFLVQKNPGIIQDEAVKISLPKGGGTLDLAQYVNPQRGTFYVGFEFPSFEGSSETKVIFVSGARKRKIGGQIFGAGCNQFFDITERFFKEMKSEGIKVNTFQERYLSVLGGTFLFSAKKDKEVHVAQVSFRHSGFSPLFCREQ